jgi:nucleotide-binding universal stress UspA family protein
MVVKMYKKILVTSTEEYLHQIIEHTLNLVNERDVNIIGLYVVDNSFPFLTPSKVKKIMIEELNQKGKNVLGYMEKEFKKIKCMIKFRPVLIEGDPAEQIVNIAEKENVDILVMGTGKSKIDKHLLGSVSEKVVHSSPCTILLVRII